MAQRCDILLKQMLDSPTFWTNIVDHYWALTTSIKHHSNTGTTTSTKWTDHPVGIGKMLKLWEQLQSNPARKLKAFVLHFQCSLLRTKHRAPSVPHPIELVASLSTMTIISDRAVPVILINHDETWWITILCKPSLSILALYAVSYRRISNWKRFDPGIT